MREVDKFDLWNTQLTIKASNQRGLKTYNRYTFAPTIDQPGMPDWSSYKQIKEHK